MNAPLKFAGKKINFILFALCFVLGARLASAETSTITVTAGDGGTVSPNYSGKQLVIGQTYKLQAKPKSGFAFTSWTGSQVTSAAKISFVMDFGLNFTAAFADVKTPKVTIKAPAKKSALTNDELQIVGMVKDNSTVAVVYYRLNGSDWANASTSNGWSNWWANVSLLPNTNVFQAYAVDTAGNVSPVASLKLNYRAAPDSLSGQTLTVSTEGDPAFTMSFTNGTFSQTAADPSFVDGVGTYTYKRVGSTTGKLTVKYTAPPNAVSSGKTTSLEFTGADSGVLTNGDGSSSDFMISSATSSVPASLGGAEFSLVSTNDDSQRILSFIAEPTIVDNGNLFNVANPLVISVSSAYVGNVGDRVSVLFNHFKSTSVVTNTFFGTVIAATTVADTNTVTVFFDSSSFVSQDKTYAPIAGSVLNVVTFDFTNMPDSSGTGTFAYAPYSPVGALLQLTQTNENSFYVLTFDDTGTSGTYYEQFTPVGGDPASDAGTFNLIAPPQIDIQPQSLTVSNGATATFTVSASGSAPLAYQWLENTNEITDGGNISGSATPTLTVSDVSTNDAAGYQVVVANSFGSVTSSVANLSIDTNSIATP
jgi:hypothetical protein